ncbi:MAG: CBS domain-containing protein [Nakamurella sp.]
MKVRDIMTSPAVTVNSSTPVIEVAELLARRGFTSVPVVDDDDALIGIVTEADLISGRIRPDPRIHGRVAPPAVAPAAEVLDVMTTPVASVTAGADVSDIAAMMLDERIRCFPVVDGLTIVGVVTRRDIVAAVARTDGAIRAEIDALLLSSPDLAPAHRWQVTVQGGVADIADFQDRADDRLQARGLAEHVRGVVSVQVRHQTSDPS